MTLSPFPDNVRAVVIGGGVIGCSVAYHLAKLGWRDVLLLEQGQLTCGTTWHAAGLVGQLRAHQNMTRLVQYSASLYQKLEAETGQATGWKQCGSVLVARTPERVTLFKRIASAARAQGVACEIISLEEAARKYPVMRTDDLLGGLLMGGFEPVAKPWAMDGIPDNFEFGMLPDDWDQFQILMENALIRLPALETAEIKTFMNGPESFTPDNNFIMGEAPELKNFY